MMSASWRAISRRGTSLLEAILAIAVFGIMAAASMYLVTGPLSSANTAIDRQRALFLAEEGIEAARAIKDDGWNRLTVGDHGLTDVSGRWEFSGSQDVSDDGFTRVVTVEAVERDSGGDIVLSGGTAARRARRVIAAVSWERFGISREVSSVAYLTDWDTYDWRHTTDSDFLPGEKNYTRVVGSGVDASVQLAPAEEKLWQSSEGTLVTHTTDTDWSPGTFTDTEVVGTGLPASIGQSGPLRWLALRAGDSFLHTTDADFIPGTFSNTVVVDTGNLAAVTLDTYEIPPPPAGWQTLTSPTGRDIYAIDLVSESDGWAVGDRVILRYNGSSWSDFGSPTNDSWHDIHMLSSGDGFIAGERNPLRWNGSTWNTVSAPGGNSRYYSVHMISSSDGWMGGNRGRIYRWNGSSWSQHSDTGGGTHYALYMNSASDGWIANSAGRIYRWNGASWSYHSRPAGNRVINEIDCVSASSCWAAADGGVILEWDGASWSSVSTPTGNDLHGISMVSASEGWAVGAGGVILEWDGASWSSVSSPTGSQLNAVKALNSAIAFAGGNGGVLLAYQSGGDPQTVYYASGTYLSSVYDSGHIADWTRAFWDETLPSGTDLTVAFRSGPTASPDGSWSSWSSEFTDPTEALIPSPDNQYFQYRATMSTGDPAVAPRLESIQVYFDEPSLNDYRAVKVTVPNTDGWLVGENGVIARLDGNEWLDYPSTPTSYDLYGLGFSDENDVWAVGENGVIIHWDGVSWSAHSSPTGWDLFGVDILPDGTGWAVGEKGTIIELRGDGNWYGYSSPTNKDLAAVSLSSASNGWAVGKNGTIVGWDGVDWATYGGGGGGPPGGGGVGNEQLFGVSTVSSSFAVTVGRTGAAYIWDGSTWSSSTTNTNNHLEAVSCVTDDYCWAVGSKQTFLQWDGASWSQYFFNNPTNPVVYGIHIPPTGDGYAVGESGAIYRYTALYEPEAYYESASIDSGEAGTTWNTVSWDSVEPLFTGLTVAVRTGETATPDGGWSAWSSEYADTGGSTITAPAGRYLQYRVTFTTTEETTAATLDEVRLVFGAVTAQALYDTDGTAVDDVWAVGRVGTIVHYDGTEWSLVASPVSQTLYGVTAVSQTDAWAVGRQGKIIQWDGVSWSEYTSSPTTQDLRAVFAVSSNEIWAVGDSGTIVYYDGASWSTVSSPTGNDLYGVHLDSASLGFAVGESGTIIEWDGASWSSDSSPTSEQLNAVFLVSSGSAWAVGEGGTILRWNGTAWSTETSPVVVDLNAVEARSANEAWAAGDFGTIIEWDGVSWESFTSPTTRRLNGITVYAPTDGWICGDLGVLLKDPEEYPSTGTFISTVLDTDGASQALTSFWWETNPAGTDVTVAVRSGDTPTPDGSWSAWSSELTDETGTGISLPSARYFQYRLTLTTGDPLLTPSLDEILVTYTRQ